MSAMATSVPPSQAALPAGADSPTMRRTSELIAAAAAPNAVSTSPAAAEPAFFAAPNVGKNNTDVANNVSNEFVCNIMNSYYTYFAV
jgi:hypothetical protein